MSNSTSLTFCINKLIAKNNISSKEASEAFNLIMDGNVSNIQIAAFLIALQMTGETSIEITSICNTLLNKIPPIKIPPNTIDIVGTGGSGNFALNVSTACCFLVASCGVPVAKHGNKGVSSKVGASDVLQALGLDISLNKTDVMNMLKETNFGFLMAPLYHSSMRHVAFVRKELATPTIFNIVGPLVNPARVQKSIIGSYNFNIMKHMAVAKANLGTKLTWFVHGANNTDELTTYGINKVIEVKNTRIKEFNFDATNYGFSKANIQNGNKVPDSLMGHDSKYNANRMVELFKGRKDEYRNQVILNSGVALMIAGKVQTIESGIKLAENNLDNHSAYILLQKCINYKALENNIAS